jgi:hypothetical protein
MSETNPPVTNCTHIEPQSTASRMSAIPCSPSSGLISFDIKMLNQEPMRGLPIHYEIPSSLRLLTLCDSG